MSLHDFKHDLLFPRPGIGIDDKNIRVGSGVRTDYLSMLLINDPQWFSGVPGVPVGLTSGSPIVNTATWADMTETIVDTAEMPSPIRERMPYPCTPRFAIRKTNLVDPITPDSYARFRITGFDQFGNAQVEVTPWLSFGEQTDIDYGAIQDAGYHFYASKVFSSVTRLEYQANSIASGDTHTAFVGVGFEMSPLPKPTYFGIATESWLDTAWDPIAARGNRGGYWNQGIGLSRKMTPWIVTDYDAGGNPREVGGPGKRDILSGRIYNIDDDVYGIIGYAVNDARGKQYRERGKLLTQEPQGGFLVGNSDTALTWDGDPDKVTVFFFPGADESGWDIPRFPNISLANSYMPPPTAFGLMYKLDVWLRTTIGEAHGEFTQYPTYRP